MTKQSKEILVVEDSPVQAETLRRVLFENGYKVILAKNGAEGLETIRKKKPDLIISDILMPVMDGYQMCGKIKQSAELRNIPVLLLTQLVEPEEVIRGLESGADNYLTKPFNEVFLLSKVKTLLENPYRFKNRPDRKSIEFEYDGKRYEVHSGRSQTLSYLISTYQNAVLKTKEVESAREELRNINERLEEKVKERTAALISLNEDLSLEVAERKKAEETIRRMAYFDSLTSLPNKTHLYQYISNVLTENGSQKRPFALLMLDLNRFHEINEALGYHQGNDLLKIVGVRLQSLLNDIYMLARCNADVFAVMMPGVGSEYAVHLAREILKILDEPFDLSGLKLYVQASIGISLFPGHGNETDIIVRRAEMAMHRAKKESNAYSLFNEEFENGTSRRLAMAGDLRYAIENNELILYCQPKVDLKSGLICGAEALLRWQHAKHGMVSPIEFIPIAENTGLIKPLTYWVLDAAVRQCFAWQKENVEIPLAVNLSVRNLHDPLLIDKIKGMLITWGIKPSGLEVELTESAFTEDSAVYNTLTQIRNMGINIYIDDFGTGYSSLSYLQRLPINAIKVDKSFVFDMTKNEKSMNIINSTLGLARNMGLKVVAEGVEDKDIYNMLLDLGCNEAQGYYISKPMPIEQFQGWLEKSPWKIGRAV